MTKFVEFTIKIIGEEYKDNKEVYSQKLNYDYVFSNDPYLFQKVIATINKLQFKEEKIHGKRFVTKTNIGQKDI